MNTTSLDQIISDILQARKDKKWLSCTYRINTDNGIFSFGVKAFGLWVQRVECCGLTDSIPEQKTVKAFKEAFTKLFNSMVPKI